MTKPGSETTVAGPVVPGARRERARATRAQILRIAKRHFARAGYRGVRTAAIAAEVGISDPGLLHHFQSKRGLLTALLEERYGDDESIFTLPPDGDPFAHLERIVRENQHNRVDVLLYSVLLAESLDEEQASNEWFARRFDRIRQLVGDSISAAQNDGSVRPDLDPHDAAAFIIAAMDGLQYQWLLDPGMDMGRAFRGLCVMLQNAPFPPAPPRPASKTCVNGAGRDNV